MVNPDRVQPVTGDKIESGVIAYWMSRDHRVADNWALLYAKQLADETHSPLLVVFNLVPDFLYATIRQYEFMLKGLEHVESKLRKLNIPMFLLLGEPQNTLPLFVAANNISALVTDFNPLKISRLWKKQVESRLNIPFHIVDAHNIIPPWTVSNKQEFAAYTIRPKIHKLLNSYLTDFPVLKKHRYTLPVGVKPIDWQKARRSLNIDSSVEEIDWLRPGEDAALKSMYDFLDNKLHGYDSSRNDPNLKAQSSLSPYLHFGQLSPQRLAFETLKYDKHIKSQEAYIEELVVRRELAENYCLYNDNYDNFDGFPSWAKQTLNEHRRNKREYVYELDQFELTETHDDLWNAAQMEMVISGKMHGYMRMYWAKKILEWTQSPEEAQQIAIYLNDKYSLDGRDPNGYVGIAWSIGGVHDRAWPEREIFGKIRYMNYNGCKRKFDIRAYVKKIENCKSGMEA